MNHYTNTIKFKCHGCGFPSHPLTVEMIFYDCRTAWHFTTWSIDESWHSPGQQCFAQDGAEIVEDMLQRSQRRQIWDLRDYIDMQIELFGGCDLEGDDTLATLMMDVLNIVLMVGIYDETVTGGYDADDEDSDGEDADEEDSRDEDCNDEDPDDGYFSGDDEDCTEISFRPRRTDVPTWESYDNEDPYE